MVFVASSNLGRTKLFFFVVHFFFLFKLFALFCFLLTADPLQLREVIPITYF